MAIYTVHEPIDAADEVTRADRTVFIREKFTFWGFVFAPFFLLWRRLWLAFAAYVVLVAILAGLYAGLGFPSEGCIALLVLAHLFVGVEGNDLRRWALERRGFRMVEVVSSPERVTAEMSFFAGRESNRPEQRGVAQPWTAPPDPTPAVIGMFPDGSRT